jgi:hypothetical protein
MMARLYEVKDWRKRMGKEGTGGDQIASEAACIALKKNNNLVPPFVFFFFLNLSSVNKIVLTEQEKWVLFELRMDLPFPRKSQISKKSKKTEQRRSRGSYFRDRRAEIATEEGRLPNQPGNPIYLTEIEEKELVTKICEWKDPVSPPTLSQVAVFVRVSFSPFFFKIYSH